jgi:hypothetical protein
VKRGSDAIGCNKNFKCIPNAVAGDAPVLLAAPLSLLSALYFRDAAGATPERTITAIEYLLQDLHASQFLFYIAS